MEGVLMVKLLLASAENFALAWVEAHVPSVFPYSEIIEIILECLILGCGEGALTDGIICEQSGCGVSLLRQVI